MDEEPRPGPAWGSEWWIVAVASLALLAVVLGAVMLDRW